MFRLPRGDDLSPSFTPLPTLLEPLANQAFGLMPVFTGAEFAQQVQFAILVEMWDKVVPRWACGTKKRRWLAEFTPAEREKLGTLQLTFRRWHLQSGVPEHVLLSLPTFQLLQRAVAFFATV